MLLSEWLVREGVRKSHFAERVGVTPAHITGLIDGSTQPSMDLAERIHTETAGEVPPESFFRHRESQPAHKNAALSSDDDS